MTSEDIRWIQRFAHLPYKVDLCLFHQIQEQSLLDHIKRVGLSIFTKLD